MDVVDDPEDADALFRAEFERLARGLAVAFGAEAAADAVQEAFIEAHRRWRKVSRLDDPAGWVRRVALNRLIDGRRNQRRRTEILEAFRPPALVDLSAELLDLRSAIEELPERMRLATCLHYLSGFSVDEIAAALDVAPGTVKSNLHDARTKLRAALKDNSHV